MMQKLIFHCFILVFISFNAVVAANNDDTSRIMGGWRAYASSVPYMCLIKISQNVLCGCSIISPNYVLTAAHCHIWDPTDKITILVGTNNPYKPGGTIYNITKFIGHEKWDLNNPGHGNDIALIKVEGTIEFNSKVKPIKYAKKSVPVGEYAVLTGYGEKYYPELEDRIPGDPAHMQMIKLKVVPRSVCDLNKDGDIDSNVICTFNGPRAGGCRGDSGSPLVWNDVQVGIASFVSKMCPHTAGTAFTDVSVYYDWIKSHAT